MRRIATTLFCLLVCAAGAFAQEAARSRPTLGEGVVSTLAFGLIGILLTTAGFKVFDLLIKADIEKEIFENKNMAAAALSGSIIIGISIVVAATLLAP